jgi:serine/threonine kinase 38
MKKMKKSEMLYKN